MILNQQLPNQQKGLDIDLDGTLKRGGIPVIKMILQGIFSATEKEFSLPSGQKFHRTEVRGASTTISTSDYLVGVIALHDAPNVGLPLPSLVGPGKSFIVKDEVGGAATTTITISSVGEKNIDGATTSTITTDYGSKHFYSDGSNWFTW